MSRRFQFSLKALLVLTLAVSCFFAGDRFGRDRQRRDDLLAEQIAAEQRHTQAMKKVQEFQASMEKDMQSLRDRRKARQAGSKKKAQNIKVIPDVA